jgi:hypothetical protein
MATSDQTVDLHPYLLRDTWVFDDPRTGLKEEAFVVGATDMISRLIEAKSIPEAEKGFLLTFAAAPFDGYDVRLAWLSGNQKAGNWYAGDVAGHRMEGWLCPALYCYFSKAPPEIYVRAERLPEGVEPIWNPPAGTVARRFIEAPHPGQGGEARP